MDKFWYYGTLLSYLGANEWVEMHRKYDDYERQSPRYCSSI